MKRDQFEAIALVNRLWGYYLQQGLNPQQAIESVESKLEGKYSDEVEIVKKAIFSNVDSVQSKDHHSSLFTSLSNDVRELGGDHQNLISNTAKSLHKASTGFKSCSRFFSTLYLYPAIILFVSTIIYFLYKLFVFPQMVEAIGELETFPELSRLVFSSTSGIIVLVTIVILVIIAIWQNRQLLRSFATYQPASSLLGHLTLTDQHQRYLLFLVYLITLLKSGLKPNDSIEKAKKYSKIDQINLKHYQTHQIALSAMQNDAADLIEEEVDFQFDDVLNGLDSVLTAKQEKVLFMFQAFIFVFVGLIIMAMYLPIFKLANMV